MDNPRLVNLVGALGLALADGQRRVVTAASGLASSEAAALNFVGQTPGCSIESVRTALAISHPGTVRVIDRLAGRGLVERRAGVDGRTRGLWLTPSGKDAWVRLSEARLAWLDAVIDRLDRTEQAQLESAVEDLLMVLTPGYDESEHMCRLCDLASVRRTAARSHSHWRMRPTTRERSLRTTVLGGIRCDCRDKSRPDGGLAPPEVCRRGTRQSAVRDSRRATTEGRHLMTTVTDRPTSKSASDSELEHVDRWWRAANYLSVGQIYLLDNPLLREPLAAEHVKPRLLGHWGTTPGLNLVYAHLNRVIRDRDLDAIYVMGPGHGGPAAVANAWLEGTWSEVYRDVGRDEDGMRRLFRQFSFPGGIPSHVAPETPGSIHEGGELGYALAHAYGAAFDNPDLVVACVVGDGEAETGPLAASWHSNKFLDPARDGAVLPILHLNGYKIANPTVLARIPEDELRQAARGLRPRAASSSPATTRPTSTAQMAAALDKALDGIAEIQRRARQRRRRATDRPGR